jgi:glycosyltransferase involved in cell wall biosynthesis
MNGFSPDAVLTVTHGFSWRTAARFAADKQLPLHLICHDDLPRMDYLPDRFGSWIDNEFGRIYRQAKSRLCVSPFMAETYQARYGPGGTVLLPSRAADALVFTAPPREQLGANARPFTCVFAGSLSTLGYVRALRVLADALLPLQGRLLLFTPLTPERVAGAGLAGRNVEIRGLLESPDLIKRCRDEADMLFVPMSFERVDKANTEISFPSKLTDYTVMGLPLLIQGPTYSSAVRWARDYPGVAEVVDTDDADRLAEAVKRLERNPEYRTRLAAEALAVGNRLFSHATAWATFHGALTRGRGPVPLG